MNETFLKALVLLLLTGLVFTYFLVLTRRKIPWSRLQLIGAACLLVVVLTHICEALSLFPWMHWGAQRSVGHYLDLFRSGRTCQLLITRHEPGHSEGGRRPPLASSVVFPAE